MKGGDKPPPIGHLPDSDEAVVQRMIAALPKHYPEQHIVPRPYTLGSTTFFTLENVPLSICEAVFITLQDAIWWDDDGGVITRRSASKKPPSRGKRSVRRREPTKRAP